MTGPVQCESVLLAKQLQWREKALIMFKRKWDERVLSSMCYTSGCHGQTHGVNSAAAFSVFSLFSPPQTQ